MLLQEKSGNPDERTCIQLFFYTTTTTRHKETKLFAFDASNVFLNLAANEPSQTISSKLNCNTCISLGLIHQVRKKSFFLTISPSLTAHKYKVPTYTQGVHAKGHHLLVLEIGRLKLNSKPDRSTGFKESCKAFVPKKCRAPT
jgi:hypothetical protein